MRFFMHSFRLKTLMKKAEFMLMRDKKVICKYHSFLKILSEKISSEISKDMLNLSQKNYKVI